MKGTASETRTEFGRYLNEKMGEDEGKDVLLWWKLNEPRFPVVARMAHDILDMSLSTVALKTAYSAGGRHLDRFRSSLSPKMVQALICGKDWLRATRPRLDGSKSQKFDVEEYLDDLEEYEKNLEENEATNNIIYVAETGVSHFEDRRSPNKAAQIQNCSLLKFVVDHKAANFCFTK